MRLKIWLQRWNRPAPPIWDGWKTLWKNEGCLLYISTGRISSTYQVVIADDLSTTFCWENLDSENAVSGWRCWSLMMMFSQEAKLKMATRAQNDQLVVVPNWLLVSSRSRNMGCKLSLMILWRVQTASISTFFQFIQSLKPEMDCGKETPTKGCRNSSQNYRLGWPATRVRGDMYLHRSGTFFNSFQWPFQDIRNLN